MTLGTTLSNSVLKKVQGTIKIESTIIFSPIFENTITIYR